MGGFSLIIVMSILSIIFIFFITILIGIIMYIIMSYIFESITIKCMSKKLGYNNSITAWLPFYNKYLLGEIAGNKIIGGLLGILSFISICLVIYFYIYQKLEVLLFIILVIILIISFILDIIIAHKIYKNTSEHADILTLFNILSLGILRPIFLFIVRNK